MQIHSRAILEAGKIFGSNLGTYEHYLGRHQPHSQYFRCMTAHFGMGPLKVAKLWNYMDLH